MAKSRVSVPASAGARAIQTDSHHTVSRLGRRLKPEHQRRGFSLLEILLALAILGGSLAALSQMASIGMDSAREAREMSIARITCQTILNELLIQNITPTPLADTPVTPCDSSSIIPYSYSVDVQPGALDGMLIVRVTVVAENPDDPAMALATCSLTRWMIDPALGLAELEAAEKEAAAAEAEAVP